MAVENAVLLIARLYELYIKRWRIEQIETERIWSSALEDDNILTKYLIVWIVICFGQESNIFEK